MIGTSSVARAFSTYFDSLVDNSIQNFFRDHFPMNIHGLSKYPDFFALAITLLITGNMKKKIPKILKKFFCMQNSSYRSKIKGLLASGVKESSRMNNIFTGVNLCIVTFIIIFGSIKANFHNWHISPDEVYMKINLNAVSLT